MSQQFSGPMIEVRDEWIDYNDHLTDSAYSIVCAAANEAFLESLGISTQYQAETGCTMYTVESHLRYLAEVHRGAQLRSETFVVAADTKRLQVHTTLFVDETAVLTGEYLFLHFDQKSMKVVPFPDDRQAAVAAVVSEHAGIERPPHVGRGVGATR